jgi:DNA-binding response OmpR family regulator
MKDIKIPQAAEPASPQARSPTSPPLRILVVEDDTAIRQFSAEVLVRSGYQVDAAEDGAAAWEALYTSSYDLLITDNNMPNVSGVELLKRLRSACMTLPVILATGTLPALEFAQSPWLIPNAMLLKPFTMDQLLGTVAKVLPAAGRARQQIRPLPSRQASRQPGNGCDDFNPRAKNKASAINGQGFRPHRGPC